MGLNDIHGEVVSEEETATGLGFANINEFRRWRTEVGHENNELKHQLRLAKDEGERFRWSLKRAMNCLRRIEDVLDKDMVSDSDMDRIVKVCKILRGAEIDWNHEFDEWFK